MKDEEFDRRKGKMGREVVLVHMPNANRQGSDQGFKGKRRHERRKRDWGGKSRTKGGLP